MVLFALLHLLAFNFQEYKMKRVKPMNGARTNLKGSDEEHMRQREVYTNARNAFNLKDVIKDAYYNFSHKYRSHVQLAAVGESDSEFGGHDQERDDDFSDPMMTSSREVALG